MMNTSQPPYYSVIPPGNFKCVWMTAGILSYQLCDRMFDCDSCPLDQAMRKHFVDRTTEHRTQTTPSGMNMLRYDCLYSPHHCWMKEVSANRFRIGIEPALAGVFPNPKAIVLPLVGQRFKKNKVSLWVIYDDGIFPVYSPMDGAVVAVNSLINEQPQMMIDNPFENGWFYEVVPDLPLPPALMNSFDASRKYKQDSDRFKDLLLSETHRLESNVGYTLPDGGLPAKQASEMIGQKRYLQLLLEVFGKQ